MADKTIATNEALLKIVEAVTSTLVLDDLLKSILLTLKEVTEADSASILLQEQGRIVVKAGIGFDIEEEAKAGYSQKPDEGLAGAIFSTRKSLYVQDVSSDPRVVNPYLRASGIRSFLGVPINNKGETIGILHIGWRAVHRYTEKELGLLTIVADRCGAAIENARQHAELAETSSYMENLLDNANAPIIVWDSDLRITKFNHAFENLTGLRSVEIIGKRLDLLFPPNSRESSIEHVHKASSGIQLMGVELPILGASGTIRTVLWNSANIYNAETSKVIATIAQGLDITERKQAEAALQESEERFRVIAETAPMHISVSRASDNIIVFTNPAYDEAFGFARGEPIGHLAPDLYVNPEDRRKLIESLNKKRKINEFEVRVKRKDGTSFWVEASAASIRFRGERAYLGVSIDITERKRKEEMLQAHRQLLETIVNFMPAAVCLIRGSDLRLQLANPNYHAIGPGKDMLGKTLNEIWPETGRDFEDLCRKVLATGETHLVEDEPFIIRRRPDGPLERAYFSWSLHRVLLPGDEGWGILNTAWETTGRMKIENEIKEERDRLASLINSIEDEVWFANKDGVFTLENPSAHKEFGFLQGYENVEVEDLANSLEVFRADGSKRPVEEAPPLQALKGISVKNLEEIIRMPKTGELRHRQVTSSPVRDIDGNIIGSVSVVRDITERKEAEMQLQEARDYLENLINYANAPIIVWDSDFKITRFNRAFEHLTGHSTDHVLGKRLDFLFPEERKDSSMELIHRTSKGEHWESVEIPILCASGQVRTVLWNSATLFYPGTERVMATIAQGQDITDRKEAEMELAETSSYLQNLIDYANAPIIVWDPDFRIIRFNHAFEHLTGREASQVIGERLEMLFPPISCQDSMEKIHRTSSGEHWESVEIPIQRVDGRVRVVLWNSATIYLPGTDLVFATIAQGQDITDRKGMERELMRSNAELEQFAYVASHDLKEPLRMISGFLELLAVRYKGKIDKEADEYIRHAIDGAKRMNWLIEDLLQFSRIGRALWKPEPTSMEEAYQQALNNLAIQVRDSGAEVIRGPLPTLVVDRIQMTILLQNLIGNAIKFHGSEPPRVEVQANMEGGAWVFSVRDNGIGFPEEYKERIFMMFERLHSKEKYPGTGIGLAICKKIVERHGGSIWAESKEKEGSTFYFSIPSDMSAVHEQ